MGGPSPAAAGTEAAQPRRGHHRVHRPVVRLGRDVLDDFRVVQQDHQRGPRARTLQTGQDAVVRPSAAPQPHPARVDRQPRQQHDVGPGHGVLTEPLAGRLEEGHLPSVLHAREGALAGVSAPVQVVVGQERRQQDPHAQRAQPVQEREGARLAPHGDVRGHRARVRQLRQTERAIGERVRRLPHVVRRQSVSHREELSPQHSLVRLSRTSEVTH